MKPKLIKRKRITTPPPPPPIKPVALKKRVIDLNTKLKKGERFKFDFRFRSKGKTITIPVGKPINEALRKAVNAVDKTTSRSMELVVSGITKAKDIPASKQILKKFRLRKKNSRALKLVEFRKFAIDTRGEKKGLKLAKLLKKKKQIKKKPIKRKTKKRQVKKKKSISNKTFVKGSTQAKKKMAKLRSMRKK